MSGIPSRLLLLLLAGHLAACTQTEGTPLPRESLGLSTCTVDDDCGAGRFCHEDGFCDLQCREDGDCGYQGTGLACDAHGRCRPDPLSLTCRSHADCGEGGYCNRGTGRCGPFCRVQGDCARAVSASPELTAYCQARLPVQCLACSPFGVCVAEDEHDRCTTHAECGPGRYCNVFLGLCGPACTGRGDCLTYCEASAACVAQCTTQGLCPLVSSGDDPPCCDYPGHQLECTPSRQCLETQMLRLGPESPHYVSPITRTLPCPDRDSVCPALGFAFTCSATKVCQGTAGEVDFGTIDPAYSAAAYVGIWGGIVTIASVSAEVPLLGVQRVASHKLELVKITHEQDDLIWTHKVCALDVENFTEDGSEPQNLSRVLSPANYIRALDIIVHRVRDVTAATPGTLLLSDRFFEPRGWREPSPSLDSFDALPTRDTYLAGDDRIIDQDRDGRPGMTNVMDGVLRGEIYNVSLMMGAYGGQLVDADHISGLLTESRNTVHNVDASSPILIQNLASTVHPDPNRTFFRMQRLPATATCEDVLELASIPGHWLSRTRFLGDVTLPE
ncbi:MAG: hypothetical protein RBU45_08560 [Myxococcota bacterium]|nr:hypothetical protein [Myxococcota bacterium]